MTSSVFTKDYQHLRSLLKKHRVDQGLTQSYVAQALKRPQSFVSKYESGERRLDVIEFLEVSKILNIDPSAFIKRFVAGE